MKDGLKLAAAIMLVTCLISFGWWLALCRWHECRRIHPWWYCAGEGNQ